MVHEISEMISHGCCSTCDFRTKVHGKDQTLVQGVMPLAHQHLMQ